jgi:hypothetical protein
MTEQRVLPRIEQNSMNRSEVAAVIRSYSLPVCFAGGSQTKLRPGGARHEL